MQKVYHYFDRSDKTNKYGVQLDMEVDPNKYYYIKFPQRIARTNLA